MKKILIAIPTARYVECDTFKSIYDLEIPPGYTTELVFFYGYRVDQVRNLIADWIVNGFDYLFAVDHDVTFASDTLIKMLSHDVPLVTGIYRQRIPEQKIEIYNKKHERMNISDLYGRSLVEIGACGFGCVLVKKEVLQSVGYPQFEYHVALDHTNTVSEDTDFCKKATDRGFKLYCDPTILCGHIGSQTLYVDVPKESAQNLRLRELHNTRLLPKQHVDFLWKLKSDGVEPKVIYDIGACVLHWANEAKMVWPDAEILPFEAMNEVEFLYKEAGFTNYSVGVALSDKTEECVFYKNIEHPGGNSLFQENPALSPSAAELFKEENRVMIQTQTLDGIVKSKNLPLPDMIKMDIQGAELNALKGALNVLRSCKYIILELQHKEYNLGAPKSHEVIDYLHSIGFIQQGEMFCGSALGIDGDYYFTRITE